MKQAVILFTRVPEAGKTKTRMMPYLTPGQCEKLHTCFLKDIRRQCESCKADIFVCCTPGEKAQRRKLETVLGKDKIYFPQEGEGLGERMYNAMRKVLERGYEKCILLGTDVPELRTGCLEKGFRKLEEKEIVFGRTEDGGYYLIGMRKAYKEPFGLSGYGHGTVFDDTRKILDAAGITVGYTETLCDMDTPKDLREYRQRMRERRMLQESETGKYLARIVKISIIIPVYNEAKTILAMQDQLDDLRGKCEILFVDGGSTDGTTELIKEHYRVLTEGKGRAAQMNAGAKAASGDILFFLHCDSELPARPLEEIKRVMKKHRAGCFGIAFHSRNFFMWTCRVISNHRVKDRKVMFGDQGIFLDRNLFFEAGMFPDIPIMEDYQLSLTLKEMGVKLGMTKQRIYTSDRRFPKGTISKLKVMWKMNRLRKMYRDGVDIKRISAMYRDVR
ncbi:MAG: TIGR04283 family arsenosugar biosynthesis glycosyltransferase [Lachnospiraceae bacterium]|nr:TIGR04283 family arsenosugar biosynthesis glycosyltransferase [Lachnospiraceae bacterium]